LWTHPFVDQRTSRTIMDQDEARRAKVLAAKKKVAIEYLTHHFVIATGFNPTNLSSCALKWLAEKVSK
jgi:hypothetical protein